MKFNELVKNIDTINCMLEKEILHVLLDSISINNLRNFEKHSVIDFKYPITFLVGKNGSGKTTLLRVINSLSKGNSPQKVFFETDIDDCGMNDASFAVLFGDNKITCCRNKSNNWTTEGEIASLPCIEYIQPKSIIGAIDQSLRYSNIGKKTKPEDRVEYTIHQIHKILQSKQEMTGRKKQHVFSSDAVDAVNYILESSLSGVYSLKHKFFNGYWGIDYIFAKEKNYSEYNAGSGEFVVASIVEKIEAMPSNSILLLDEPEVSLHPGAQKRLMNYLAESVKAKRLQVIISTHSPNIIRGFPNEAIKCLHYESNKTQIIEDMPYKYAFLEIQENVEKKTIIVEDNMAKRIIDAVAEEERVHDLVDVSFFPGGASYIKSHTILSYSRTKINNRYIFLDGDQNSGFIPDLDSVPEKEKNYAHYSEIVEKMTGIKACNIQWGMDANRNSGRVNCECNVPIMEGYIRYFQTNVFYLPQNLPEDMVFDEDEIKYLLRIDKLPNFSSEDNSKEKIKIISDNAKIEQSDLIGLLIRRFIIIKNEDYQRIAQILHSIVK